MAESAPARSITKSIAIDRPPGEVSDYLADARNWPEWPVVNGLAIEATSDPGWWKTTTPRGIGELRIRGDAATGLADHDFRDPQAAWTVPVRVLPTGQGAEFLITFFRPPSSMATSSTGRPPWSTPNWPLARASSRTGGRSGLHDVPLWCHGPRAAHAGRRAGQP